MISKGEAIQRLKKMGVTVAEDQSIVTVLLPEKTSLSAGIKDIKEKLKAMDYDASFCIRQSKSYSTQGTEEESAEETAFPVEDTEETVTQEEIDSSLISMDDDGQFTLGGFGLDF